jgi:hypothetical protein
MQRVSLAMESRKACCLAVSLVGERFAWNSNPTKRVIGTVERYRDEGAARSAVTILLREINSHKLRMGSCSITVAQLCDHFRAARTR